MAYTLIASLGTGMYDGGYRETTYIFKNGKQEKTAWFLQALLNSRYREFNKIILVGTRTSNWDALIDLNDYSAEQLWEELSNANLSKTGIPNELISSLEQQLSKQYGVPVKIIVHTAQIDADTTNEVFTSYHEIINEIPENSDILFDITHGFRSMPILMFQNLQLIYRNNGKTNVEFVYGEFIKDEKISYVRDLTNFWILAQISDALNIFKNKLDGFKLADLIEKEWPAGSKAIRKLSEIVQTNFALQFFDVTKQIKNCLNNLPELPYAWIDEIEVFLGRVLKLLDNNSMSRTLYKYSQFLFDLNLNTQAVITMQVAVETAIVEKFGDVKTNLGDYDWISEKGRDELKKLRNKNYKELDSLFNLERFRNQIAHGGGKNKASGFPAASNIPSIYKSGKTGIENLYKILEI